MARKIEAMRMRFGPCEGHVCRDCMHLIGGEYRGRHYYKCKLYGLSHSEATDWRLSWQACGMYNIPQDMTYYVPLIRQILPRKVQPPLEGQTVFEI